jgi:hypothetical protein
MLSSELSVALASLVAIHGDCPVFHEENGQITHDTSQIQSIEAITQTQPPFGRTPLVPVGTTFFLIR